MWRNSALASSSHSLSSTSSKGSMHTSRDLRVLTASFTPVDVSPSARKRLRQASRRSMFSTCPRALNLYECPSQGFYRCGARPDRSDGPTIPL